MNGSLMVKVFFTPKGDVILLYSSNLIEARSNKWAALINKQKLYH